MAIKVGTVSRNRKAVTTASSATDSPNAMLMAERKLFEPTSLVVLFTDPMGTIGQWIQKMAF